MLTNRIACQTKMQATFNQRAGMGRRVTEIKANADLKEGTVEDGSKYKISPTGKFV